MIVGGYTLDLYCDAGNAAPDMPKVPYHDYLNEGRASFNGPDEADCKRQAREKGWKLARDRRAYCKLHANG